MSLSRRLLAGGLAVVAAGTAFAGFASAGGATPAHAQAHRRLPIVIAHRGASAYRPEESVHAYQLAIEMGADYIEPDVVTTKDHVLVARHDNWLNDTTDVAAHPEFAGLKKTKTIDGVQHTDWFTEDFTFAQLRTLRLKERLPDLRPGSSAFDGIDPIARLDEVLKIARDHHVGVYPETKHPTYHERLGLPLEAKLVATLRRHGLNHKGAAVFIQSFEQFNLIKLNRMTPLPLVQLVDANDVNPDGTLDYTAPFDRPYDWTASGDPKLLARTFGFFATDAGLAEISKYADVISPWKRYIVSSAAVDLNHDGTVGDENGDGATDEADRKALPPTDLIQRAHRHGLKIHTWTFRDERKRLLNDYNNPLEEYLQFYELGIDGVFSDFTGTAVAARHLFELER
jgi:glycerophosphoryl diester phosphodiesterase